MESYGFPMCIHLSGPIGLINPKLNPPQVNTASRMESYGFPMCIHLSSATHARLSVAGMTGLGFADCGVRTIKGKGPMNTFLVKVGHTTEGHTREGEHRQDSLRKL